MAGALLTPDLQDMGVGSVQLRAEGVATPRIDIKFSRPWELRHINHISDDALRVFSWLDEVIK